MVLVATQVKRRRGTTAENDAFTGAEGEITVDTEKHELRVHDGQTQGGFKVGSGTGALIIGQILEVVGTADYTPVGCLLADGAEYTKAQFPDLWADFLTGTPKLQTCTYTEYANQIAEYGFCNKFAVDTTNETFKVPTRNKYRKLVKKIVNGTSWANIYDDGWCEQSGLIPPSTTAVSFVFPMAGSSSQDINLQVYYVNTNNTGAPQTGNVSYVNPTTSGFTTTSSTLNRRWVAKGYMSTIPDSTANITREFVVVANGTLNQEQMDWSAWASSLAGKANIDLSNTPANVDYVVESQEPTSANGYTWYRKYKSGWVEQGGITAKNISSVNVTLPVEMLDANYHVDITIETNGNGSGGCDKAHASGTRTTTTLHIDMVASAQYQTLWKIIGKYAQ